MRYILSGVDNAQLRTQLANDEVVNFPAGEIYIDSPLVCGLQLKHINAYGCTVLPSNSFSGAHLLEVHGTGYQPSTARIYQLTILGLYLSGRGRSINGFSVQYTDHCTIRDVFVLQCYGIGLYATNNWDLIADNYSGMLCGTGAFVTTTDTTNITNCARLYNSTFEKNTDTALKITESNNIWVHNNKFHGIPGSELDTVMLYMTGNTAVWIRDCLYSQRSGKTLRDITGTVDESGAYERVLQP